MATAHAPAATETRSVRAATERLFARRIGPDLYEVYNEDGDYYVVDAREPACQCRDFEYRHEDLGEHGCKHVRRILIERGELDIEPLLEAGVRVDPLLVRALEDGDGDD